MAVTATDTVDPMEEFVAREVHPKPFRPEEIDPALVVISFDRRSDTLLIHLFGRGRESISVPVADYLYVMVDPDTEVIIGFHIEGFLSQAVKDIPEAIELLGFAEIRGITPAEVWILQNETLGVNQWLPMRGQARLGRSIQHERMRAVSSFMDAERSRWDPSFVPVGF